MAVLGTNRACKKKKNNSDKKKNFIAPKRPWIVQKICQHAANTDRQTFFFQIKVNFYVEGSLRAVFM